MQTLPSVVIIGAIDYEVKEEARTGVDGLYGTILYSDSVISIMPGQSPVHKEITLWHEMLHGIMRNAGIKDHDETVIIALSHGIVQLLKDNPLLVRAGQ